MQPQLQHSRFFQPIQPVLPKHHTFNQCLGIVLRERRKSMPRGMTQVQLSHRSGIDRSFLSDLEHGKKGCTVQTLFILGQSLKVSGAKLLQDAEQMFGGNHAN